MLGYRVEREIPPKFLDGIANGDYVAYGGVIRDARGQIVAHLQAGSSEGMKKLADHVPSLTNLASASVALQGVNLAVNVIGFAIVCQKLNRVDQRLQEMYGDIKLILEGQRRVEMLEKIEMRSAYLAQIKNLVSGIRTNNDHRINAALNDLTFVGVFQRELTQTLLSDIEEVYNRPEPVRECLRVAIASDLTLANVHFLRGHIDEAIATVEDLDEWHSECIQIVDEPHRLARTWLHFLTPTSRAASRQLVQEQRGLSESIAYAKYQYEFCRDFTLAPDEFVAEFTDEQPIKVFIPKP